MKPEAHMHRLRRFFLRLLNVVGLSQERDADLAREISAHLTLLEDEYRHRGLSSAEARRQARIALGGIEQTKELHRGARSLVVIDDFIRDIQIAARMLRREWGASLVLSLTIALGIGANTAVFSVIEAVFLRPLPVRDPARLVLFSGDPGGGTRSGSAPQGEWNLFSSDAADFLRASPSVFESV